MQKPWCGYSSCWSWINISYWWNCFRFFPDSICEIDKVEEGRRGVFPANCSPGNKPGGVRHSPFSILLCFFFFFLLSNLFRAKVHPCLVRDIRYPMPDTLGNTCVWAAAAYDSLIIWRVCIFNEYSRRKWIHLNTLSIRHSVTSWTGVGPVEEGTRFPIYF